VIKNHTVVVSSPQVAVPRKVSYACWQNPEGCNLYNKEGLPAAPFHVEAVTVHHSIGARAGDGGDISPSGTRRFLQRMTALYTIQPKPGYFIQDVLVDGSDAGQVDTYAFNRVEKGHTLAVRFRGSGGAAGSIPRPEELLFACRAESLPANGACAAWPASAPAGRNFTAIGWISEGYVQDRGPGAGGPCYQWTRKVKGKTLSVALSKEQFEWLRAAIVQWRELQATLKEMQRLSRRVLFETVPHPHRRKKLGQKVLGLM
jgi:hypothetical protein